MLAQSCVLPTLQGSGFGWDVPTPGVGRKAAGESATSQGPGSDENGAVNPPD